MVDKDFLILVLVLKPEFPVGSQEQVDCRVSRQGMQRSLPEASNDSSLSLNGDNLGESTLGSVRCGVVNLLIRDCDQ